MTKILAFATVAAMTVSSVAYAGGLAPIVDEQEEIILAPAPKSSASDYIVPLLLLGLIAVASSSSGTDTDAETDGGGTDGLTDLLPM